MWSRACLLCMVLTLLAPGLGSSQTDPASEWTWDWDTVRRLYERARRAGEEVPGDVYEWVRQDLAKMGDWQYRVVDMAAGHPKVLEKRLNKFGRSRWELVWIERRDGRVRLFLKRPVRSYLRSVPTSQVLRLVPGGGGGE